MVSGTKTITSARRLSRIALCVALLAIGARIHFPLPFYPVGFSMQTLVLLLIALVLSPKDAFAATAAYVGLGLCGLPFFVSGGGPSYIMQPSFGYILAFLLSAPLASWLSRRQFPMAGFVGCIAATLCITLMGALYFAVINRYALHSPVTLQSVIYMTLIYLPLDFVKMLLAMGLHRPLKQHLSRWL